jgi:hypothetical protein
MSGWAEYNVQNGVFSNKSIGATCIAIQQALLEKGKVDDFFIHSKIKQDMDNRVPTKLWRDEFQKAITRAIPVFVNHTDNEGDWSDKTDPSEVAPKWTEESLLAHLGEDRIPVPLSFTNSLWISQQFRILNLLRWTSGYGLNPSKEGFSQFGSQTYDKEYQTEDDQITWTQVKTNFDNLPWIPGFVSSSSLIPFFSYQSFLIDGIALDNRWGIIAKRNQLLLERDDIQVSVDVYTNVSERIPYWLFQPIGASNGKDKYIKIISTTESLSHTLEVLQESDFDGTDFIDPATAPDVSGEQVVNSERNPVFEKEDPFVIFKYDGPSGFQFKDS